jgi:imidazoleglycerol phosphate synthase glutamine amidotransferase subunit HisH
VSAPLIAVLDYGIGNLRSAQKALQRVAPTPAHRRPGLGRGG